MDKIKYCELTNQTSAILHRFNASVVDEKADVHDGVDVEGKNCYSLCKGTVVAVGKDVDGKWAVTVEIDEYACARYCGLESVDSSIEIQTEVGNGTFIGTALNYIHLELCTLEPDQSRRLVRINGVNYYKADPYDLLTGTLLM